MCGQSIDCCSMNWILESLDSDQVSICTRKKIKKNKDVIFDCDHDFITRTFLSNNSYILLDFNLIYVYIITLVI